MPIICSFRVVQWRLLVCSPCVRSRRVCERYTKINNKQEDEIKQHIVINVRTNTSTINNGNLIFYLVYNRNMSVQSVIEFQAVLKLHASAVVYMLKSDRPDVLIYAMKALCMMSQVELANHIGHVVHILTLDTKPGDQGKELIKVRITALETLQKLKLVDLANHIVVLVRALSYPQVGILAMQLLSRIAPTDLKTHAVEMVQEGAIRPIKEMLDDSVQFTAVRMMPAILTLHMIASVNEADSIGATPGTMRLHDIIPTLITLLHDSDLSTRDEFTCSFLIVVIQTLVHLAARSAYHCASMLSEDVLRIVTDIICGSSLEPDRIREAAVLLLHTLSSDFDARWNIIHAIDDTGNTTIDHLLYVLHSEYSGDRLKELVTGCMMNLGYEPWMVDSSLT